MKMLISLFSSAQISCALRKGIFEIHTVFTLNIWAQLLKTNNVIT